MKEAKDWNHFVNLANEHGIVALSWYNITETGNSVFIPSEYLGKLYRSYLISLTRNTYLYDQLSKILELIKKEGIIIVLLKGLALEKTVYGDQGLRQMNDLDVLVPRDKVLNLRKILINNGFMSLPLKSPLYEYIILDIGKHIPALIKDDCSVEIHHNLFGTNDITLTQEFIARSFPVKINDQEAFIPSPQLFFLYLVAHLDYHELNEGSQLRQYADLILLLDSYYEEIINKQLIDFAVDAKLETQLAGKLYLLNTFWKISYPGWLTEFISRYDNSLQLDKFMLFLSHPKDNPIEDISSNYINQIKFIPGIFKKTLYIAGFIFPSIGFMKRRYKTKTWLGTVFYYPVRWYNTLRHFVSRKRFLHRQTAEAILINRQENDSGTEGNERSRGDF